MTSRCNQDEKLKNIKTHPLITLLLYLNFPEELTILDRIPCLIHNTQDSIIIRSIQGVMVMVFNATFNNISVIS